MSLKSKAIIFGNGPSINEIDFDLLINREDVSTLACNRIDLLFDKTDWRPDYYFSFTSFLKNKNRDWIKSVEKVAKNGKTICFLHKAMKTEIQEKDNVHFVDNLHEHNRNQPIPSDLFENDFNRIQLKSFSATVPLFQFCFSNGVKTIGIIGQDGYIFDRDNNHFDPRYGYESSDFKRTNDRIISLHNVIRKHSSKNGIRIYNLTQRSIIKVYPYLQLKEFLNL